MLDFSDDVIVDIVAGWTSGAVSIFCSQPIDTALTRIQANKEKSLIGKYGIRSLWRGSSAMIGAVPIQNAMMMTGYGYGKRWCEQHRPNDVLSGIFIGGCTGGIAQSFLMSPVELVKVNQQVVGRSLLSATSIVTSNIFSRRIAWKGLVATLLRDGLPHGVWFASYEMSKNYLEAIYNRDEKSIGESSNAIIPLSSGAIAAFTAWVVGYPFDIIKTRIQAAECQKSVAQATTEILKESNGKPFRAFYNGFGLKIAKAVPASAVNFYVYDNVAKEFRKSSQS